MWPVLHFGSLLSGDKAVDLDFKAQIGKSVDNLVVKGTSCDITGNCDRQVGSELSMDVLKLERGQTFPVKKVRIPLKGDVVVDGMVFNAGVAKEGPGNRWFKSTDSVCCLRHRRIRYPMLTHSKPIWLHTSI